MKMVWQDVKITYEDRSDLLKQKGLVVWFTGLSGSGKTTIAVEVEKMLHEKGYATFLIDGDDVRHSLNSDLGFSNEDREENLRRIYEVAALFKDASLITLVAVISPFKVSRRFAKERIGSQFYIEVFVKADIETCSKRDPKRLYEKAKKGLIKEFTGISSPYEEPEKPDLLIDTTQLTIEECTKNVIDKILNFQNG